MESEEKVRKLGAGWKPAAPNAGKMPALRNADKMSAVPDADGDVRGTIVTS